MTLGCSGSVREVRVRKEVSARKSLRLENHLHLANWGENIPHIPDFPRHHPPDD
jgi:hypothetical protein